MIIYKYQALGNDFLIFDCINYPENARFLENNDFLDFVVKKSDRRRIGCDQFIVMEESQSADCKIVFYNADGSRAEACGNGTVACGVYASKFLGKNDVKIQTDIQVVAVKINKNEATIELDMPQDLGLSDGDIEIINKIMVQHPQFINHISVGNPHCVIFAYGLTTRFTHIASNDYGGNFSYAGSRIENLTHIFPNRTNVEFVTQTGENKFDCFVWERGAGRTFACGTGACAVAFACVKNGLANPEKPIEITMAGSFIYGTGETPMRVLLKENTVEFTNSAFFEGEIHC
jgi:diaminopimelate epimerase